MKRIKYITAFIFLLSVQQVFSQSGQNEPIVIHLTKPNTPGYLNVTNEEGSIKITGHNGSDVFIKSSLKNKRKLKDNINVTTEERGNGVIVSVDSEDYPIDLDISVPYNFSLTLNTSEGKIEVYNISGQLLISDSEGNIGLYGISGSGVVSTVEGNIYSEFSNSGPNGPFSINTVDGKIDLILPSQIRANVKIKTEEGDIFTNFDINFNTGDAEVDKSKNTGLTRISLENWLNGRINGGGQQITVHSVEGNIYIKKGK